MRRFIIRTSLVFLTIQSLSLAQPLHPMTERFELPDGTVFDSVATTEGSLPLGARRILGIVLDTSTFKDVRRILGPARSTGASNDPHEAVLIGYRSHQDSGVYLVFDAGRPENPTDKPTSFTLCRKKVLPASFKKCTCPITGKLQADVSTPAGLTLGLEQTQVTAILGVPGKRTNSWMAYSLQSYREYSEEESLKYAKAPNGEYYKGEYIYHTAVLHFTDKKLDLIQVNVGGELDW